MAYTTQYVCQLFKVSSQTVKNWADEFASYLSPTAQPGPGRKRHFTEDDLKVFALVHDFGEQGLNYEESHGALTNGQRGEVQTGDTGTGLALLPPTPTERLLALTSKAESLQVELETTRQERDEARGQAKLLRELLNEEHEGKERQLRALYEEIARLKFQKG